MPDAHLLPAGCRKNKPSHALAFVADPLISKESWFLSVFSEQGAQKALRPRARDPLDFSFVCNPSLHQSEGLIVQGIAGGFHCHRTGGTQLRPQILVHRHPFADRHAAVKAGIETFFAALAHAGIAKPPDQALIDHQRNRARHRERIGNHRPKTLKHSAAGTGVQSRNHQMPGQSRPHRDLRRLVIAHLAQHQDLRILPQQMPRRLRIIQTLRLVHLRLHHPGNDLFHGILDGDDVPLTRLHQLVDAGIDRRRLSSPRRSGQQQQPRRLRQQMLQLLRYSLRVIQRLQARNLRLLKQPQHDLFPRHCRIGRHANVLLPLHLLLRNPPILWHRILPGLQLRQVLDSAPDPLRHLSLEIIHLCQQPIHPKRHLQPSRRRL